MAAVSIGRRIFILSPEITSVIFVYDSPPADVPLGFVLKGKFFATFFADKIAAGLGTGKLCSNDICACPSLNGLN